MSEFTKDLGYQLGNLENFFERRLNRTLGTLSLDLTSTSSYSNMGEWGYNRDKEKMKQENIGIVTDKTGVPAMFELYPGSIST